MLLIETHNAPNPRRVNIFLAEKGIDVERRELDLMAGALKSQEFTRLNPRQRVPILVLDDGCVIAETIAICRYFEALHPEPALFGQSAFDMARIEMWQRRVELGLFAAISHAFRHLNPRMAPLESPQIAAWGEANKAKCLDELALLDAQLANNRYVAGEAFSVADITALVAIDFMKPARIALPAELSNIARWYGEVSTRPSARA